MPTYKIRTTGSRVHSVRKIKNYGSFYGNHPIVTKSFSFRGQPGKGLHTKSRVIRTSGSWDNAFTTSEKVKKGRYFCENHWTVMKTFSFIGQRSKYLHIKSLVIRTSGSWNNAFTKSRKVKNGRHFFWKSLNRDQNLFDFVLRQVMANIQNFTSGSVDIAFY